MQTGAQNHAKPHDNKYDSNKKGSDRDKRMGSLYYSVDE